MLYDCSQGFLDLEGRGKLCIKASRGLISKARNGGLILVRVTIAGYLCSGGDLYAPEKNWCPRALKQTNCVLG